MLVAIVFTVLIFSLFMLVFILIFAEIFSARNSPKYIELGFRIFLPIIFVALTILIIPSVLFAISLALDSK